ncbi:MAG TPA: hypothetical protein GX507_08140 [Clostridia bacterium]|nr:hypothetical protein [Clostridia bacterium]
MLLRVRVGLLAYAMDTWTLPGAVLGKNRQPSAWRCEVAGLLSLASAIVVAVLAEVTMI